ncbi:MAG: N-6 DNA methylase [Candidatus Parvarchaeum acidophilus ARMAN-5]|uniref:site-specific DNA-methyltransferase (adenine-specific) n=1 Tax=Candidatus Parvarchaeum acidophilus ARMAN-5 TaxID=662762 RepID=D6GWA6_PARA5|nr:MAG: N-6 DNA methylase [Candidatus Parvarchaeum acidophilus ARMAN-5]
MVKSEVDAYVYIKNKLKEIGWDTRKPAQGGQLYTQNQCLEEPEIKKYLHLDRPEYTLKINDSIFWMIEAKRDVSEINKALKEAREDYAKKVNQSDKVNVLIISGVAGDDEDGYVIRSEYFLNNRFLPITINGKEITSLPSPQIIKLIIDRNNPKYSRCPINEELFLKTAEDINEILHAGGIEKDSRAKVVSALLLSLLDDTPPNINATPKVLVSDINSRVKNTLERESKIEMFDYIRLNLPSSADNHIKFKTAVIKTLRELNDLNIKSAMNSGTDVLGKFYEVFLKYGNGAKEIGIVLTPRHITQFVAEVMSLRPEDIIYDPCCGTGGFLVAAFDEIKRNYKNEVDVFKKNNIFGVDQSDAVVSLAIVNMIFRGDGKNNIIEGNSLVKFLHSRVVGDHLSAFYSDTPSATGKEPVTRVLMNPPFPTKKNDEKEYKFVDQALKQMKEGGLLFSILPYSTTVKASRRNWRRRLLENNTLLAVMTLPEDLFYPTGVVTLGIFVKKGIPHDKNRNVLWLRTLNDGLLKKKGKRLPNLRAKNDLKEIKSLLRSFLLDQETEVKNIPQFQKACPIDFLDSNLELCPEAYLDDKPFNENEITTMIDQSMRDNIAFKIKFENLLKEE